MAAEKQDHTHKFNADVSRLLDIVAHALYSNKDVFLRELISNAADACDRLRYESIQDAKLLGDDPKFRIHVFFDPKKRTLHIFDNGIGMDENELAENLGTIAQSGTAKIMEQIKSGKKSDDALNLIGQFGVGFYASFMVAGQVDVISRKAGSDKTFLWTSDGQTGYSVKKANQDQAAQIASNRGTLITLHLTDEASDFLVEEKLRQVITHYSDHIDIPIYLCEAELKDGQTPVNQASALWTRPRDKITDDQYKAFYKHVSFGFDEPLMTAHWRAEGKIEFTALLFVPTMRPWDLYDPGRKNAVKLYVRRVFISDSISDLMYPWLRFVRGVIDSEDLPLNISRESLQHNPILQKIRSSVARRVLSDLDKLSRDDKPAFETFWHQFGPAVKEGLYDAADHREAIFKICRFASSENEDGGLISLDEYLENMKDGQNDIYYISGESAEALKHSPQLEGFKARGLNVLFMTDTIDDFWLQQAGDYKGKRFKSITKGDVNFEDPKNQDESGDKSKSEKENTEPDSKLDALIALMKEVLDENISDVKISRRLTESPVCLIAPDHGVDMHMERVLKIHQKYEGNTKPVLEINPGHAVVKALKEHEGEKDNAIKVLYDLGRITQGETVSDPARFTKEIARLMAKDFS